MKKIENSASSIKPRAEAQPGRPPHAQPKQGFSPEEQMSLKLVVQPENLIKSPASRRKPVIDAKSQAAKREVLVNIRRETGNGMNVLARVEKLHPGDPHRQVGAFFQEFIIPSATGRKRTVSIKTEELYVVQMQVMVRQLSNCCRRPKTDPPQATVPTEN